MYIYKMCLFYTISLNALMHYILSMLTNAQSIQVLMRFKNCLKLGWLIQQYSFIL